MPEMFPFGCQCPQMLEKPMRRTTLGLLLLAVATLGCSSTPTTAPPSPTPPTGQAPKGDWLSSLFKHGDSTQPIPEPAKTSTPLNPQEVPPPPEPAEIKPVASLSPVRLWDEFGTNGLAADAKYKGKYVELSGWMKNIQKSEDGRYFVGFGVVSPAALPQAQFNRLPPRERKWYSEGYPPNVVCYLSSESQKAFADLKAGQNIKVVAKVVGSKRADVWQDYVVELEDARLSK